jgi:hypothetical protein
MAQPNKFDQASRLVNDNFPTRSQLVGALEIVKAVAEALRELGEVPAGTLYAALMSKLSHAEFEQIIGIIHGAGLIERDDSHLLRWIGPEVK